jgi:hypothetical protein
VTDCGARGKLTKVRANRPSVLFSLNMRCLLATVSYPLL